MPDGTVIRLRIHEDGAVDIAMTEDGNNDAQAGKWIRNGEVILLEGGEG